MPIFIKGSDGTAGSEPNGRLSITDICMILPSLTSIVREGGDVGEHISPSATTSLPITARIK